MWGFEFDFLAAAILIFYHAVVLKLINTTESFNLSLLS
jgi:hypothetical protein